MTDRVTRTYWLGIPRWRTGYERPVNWMLFRWFDFVPLMLLLAFGPHHDSFIYTVAAVWYFVLFPVVFFHRLRRRRAGCARTGHVPYRPVPEVPAWECAWCGMALKGAEPEIVATSVAHAASQLDTARRVNQARYSDRR